MDNYINEIITQNITKAINTLGIEGTLEVIEGLNNAILRGKLRIKYFELLNRR